jgi:hypothetical protein
MWRVAPVPAKDLKEYQRIWIEGLNRGDVSAADRVAAKDLTVHITGQPPLKGTTQWKGFVQVFLTAFPDLHFTMEDQVAAGRQGSAPLALHRHSHRADGTGSSYRQENLDRRVDHRSSSRRQNRRKVGAVRRSADDAAAGTGLSQDRRSSECRLLTERGYPRQSEGGSPPLPTAGGKTTRDAASAPSSQMSGRSRRSVKAGSWLS